MSEHADHSPTEVVKQPSPTFLDRENPNPQRLGVYPNDSGGLDISVLASHADAVDFCVVEGSGRTQRERRYQLYGPVEGIWHGQLDGLGEGTVYGFRAYGPWDPDAALYYNPAKLLLDPYGRAIVGKPDLSPALHAHEVDHEQYPTAYPLNRSPLNSALQVPKSAVVTHGFPVHPGPLIPWNETILYEMHVKGFTKDNPAVPNDLQGTYAGLAHPNSVAYLKALGITSVELLPIHAKMDEGFLADLGLANYWGYSTMGFFAPEPSYATKAALEAGPQAVIDEFRGMVSILHEAGLEVILDVVYNHTCESGDTGPTVSWRGLDSLAYYRYTNEYPRHSINDTGTGNTLNFSSPRVVQMTLDSLRYWVTEMGVDGFRFDLGATLGRLDTGFTPFHPLFVAMAADPVLRDVKVIAEPWDIGPGGWQTGNFPIPFAEWNDRYRDAVRTFWLTDFKDELAGRHIGGPGPLATRLSGSPDLFNRTAGAQRGPRASINFVAAHDGFTLADLTSFEHRHNMANLENNRDGSTNNLSWNHGIEGIIGHDGQEGYAGGEGDGHADPTGLVEDIFFARERSRRNLLTTLFVSAGTPMIVAGDEFGRTQYGNNNAYCQDSPISWINWGLRKPNRRMLDYTQYLIRLRRLHPVMRPSTFLLGQRAEGEPLADVSWFAANATELTGDEWSSYLGRVFQMRRSGRPLGDADLLVVFNGTLDTAEVALPLSHGADWALVCDTSWPRPHYGGIESAEEAISEGEKFAPGAVTMMEPQSIQVFMAPDTKGPATRSTK